MGSVARYCERQRLRKRQRLPKAAALAPLDPNLGLLLTPGAAGATLTPLYATLILQKPISEKAGDAARAAGEKVAETVQAAKETAAGLGAQTAEAAHRAGGWAP